MSNLTDSVRGGQWLWLWFLAAAGFALVGVREALVDSGDALFWLLIAGVFLAAGLATRDR